MYCVRLAQRSVNQSGLQGHQLGGQPERGGGTIDHHPPRLLSVKRFEVWKPAGSVDRGLLESVCVIVQLRFPLPEVHTRTRPRHRTEAKATRCNQFLFR